MLMHREAVRMVEADPSLVDRLLEILARWDTVASGRSGPLRQRWEQIVRERDWKLAVEESERGNQLRQASPMSVLLPSSTRVEIIRKVRELKDSARA